MRPLRKWLKWSLLKTALQLVTIAWAVTSTVYALRNRPEPMLIGLDENGTRLITSQTDPLVESERLKFVKEFLYLYYNYQPDNYVAQMNKAGASMSDTLWEQSKTELARIESQMKTEKIAQEAKLSDLRVISPTEYEADLDIVIRHRLIDKQVKYRAALKLSSRRRSTTNPYAWEVASLVENEIR